MGTKFGRIAPPQDEIRRLIWRWDPIGVAEADSSPSSEYDDLVSTVASLITATVDVREVRTRLVATLRDHYGLGDFGVDAFIADLCERRLL